MKGSLRTLILLITPVAMANCRNEATSRTETRSALTIFPKGEPGPSTNFTGNAFHYPLLPDDSVNNTLGNVYFEAGALTNWHSHPGGQILIITDGEGYHQIDGQPKEILRKGDVVKCPPNARHGHGAREKTSLSQLYIVPTKNGIVNWQEPVSDEVYTSVN